jgi:hypothetical protein
MLLLLLLLLCTALMNRSEELLAISQISLLHKQVMHWIMLRMQMEMLGIPPRITLEIGRKMLKRKLND